MANVYAIILTYKVPIERIMESAPAHRALLDTYYENGKILFSGIQCSKEGGAIIMKGSEQDVEDLIQNDPFYTEGLADYATTVFEVRRHQPFLEDWLKDA